jgi:hypothetical protein
VNVPLTLLCALGTAVWVGHSRTSAPAGRIPMLAAVLGTGTVLTLVLGLTLGAGRGWSAVSTLTCLGLAAVLFTGFVRNEHGSRNVLVEPLLRRTRSLRVGAAATALYMASVGSEFYLLTLLLQSLEGYTPFRAGLAFLPLAVLVTVGGTLTGRVVRWLGAARALAAGFAIATAGLVWIAVALHGLSYASGLLPGLLLSGFGHGIVYTSMFIIGTHDVPAAYQGTAGALLTTSQYLSGAVTIAVLTLALGSSADQVRFRLAFLLTAVAAAAGLILAAGFRRPGAL